MKELSVHDRPREKLTRIGAAALGDNELLAIVVGSGSHSANALTLANQILEASGGLHGMPRMCADELRRCLEDPAIESARANRDLRPS